MPRAWRLLIISVISSLIAILPGPVLAQIDTSTATFNEAVQAVKNKNYRHAVKLFSLQAENNQHDAQYNLALLMQAGKGTPQDFATALTWSWTAQLGGIEAAEELSDELTDYLPEGIIEEVRKAVAARIKSRIDEGDPAAIPQFATYHLVMLEEPDYETAYVWFSIATALGLEGAMVARDEARENVDEEKIVELQRKAGTIYESLDVKLN
ncbi:tetratricopeptide repeat protein [Alphaproteobacteria bacterium LSUCC0719]